MAYESKDIQEVIKTIPLSECTELRMSTIKDESGNFKAVDIRLWTCKKSDPEMKPTYKGIRIRKEIFCDVFEVLEQVKAEYIK